MRFTLIKETNRGEKMVIKKQGIFGVELKPFTPEEMKKWKPVVLVVIALTIVAFVYLNVALLVKPMKTEPIIDYQKYMIDYHMKYMKVYPDTPDRWRLVALATMEGFEGKEIDAFVEAAEKVLGLNYYPEYPKYQKSLALKTADAAALREKYGDKFITIMDPWGIAYFFSPEEDLNFTGLKLTRKIEVIEAPTKADAQMWLVSYYAH